MESKQVDTIKVIAVAGLKVPMEDKPRTYITEEEAVTVENSAYYQRRIVDGDLVEEKPASTKVAARAAANKTTGD